MTSITITTTAPPTPEAVTEYGDALPELIRALNHVTAHHEAMTDPADAWELILNVSMAVSRLPELLEHVTGWLNAEYEDGRLQMTAGAEFPSAVLAVLVVDIRLQEAAKHATALWAALSSAAAVAADIGVPEDGDAEDEAP